MKEFLACNARLFGVGLIGLVISLQWFIIFVLAVEHDNMATQMSVMAVDYLTQMMKMQLHSIKMAYGLE